MCPFDLYSSTLRIRIGDITAKQTAKGKPFLRLVVASGDAHILQLESPLKRDDCVDILNGIAAALPSAGAPLPSSSTAAAAAASTGVLAGRAGVAGAAGAALTPEQQAKQRVLSRNTSLFKLHRDLVGTGRLKEAEFWQGEEARRELQREVEGPDKKTGKQVCAGGDTFEVLCFASHTVRFCTYMYM
jgi:hypothetical protein